MIWEKNSWETVKRWSHLAIIALRCFRAALDLLQVYGFKALRNTQARRVPGYESKSVPVTVVSCTLGTESRYLATLRSWLSNNPSEVVIVTIDSARDRVTELISRITTHKIHVLSTPEPNFRQQMVLGIRKVKTELLVFADDRTFWGPSTLRSMTDALSDREVGGVMTMQRVIPTATTSLELTSWESFGALNLVRRNINHSFLAYFNNGQVLNLSGRTVAYRTEILQNESLLNAFLHDYWRGKHLIRTGDDNFLTTWTLHHGWKTHFVTNPHASISCSVCPDAAYIRQLLRWSRDTARTYIMDLVWAVKFGGRAHVLRCVLNILCNYMSDFAVLAEIGNLLLTSAVTAGLRGDEDSTQWSWSRSFFERFLVIAAFQLAEHYPFFDTISKLRYCMGAVTYAYVHAFIVLYALLTLNKSTWSSRPEAAAVRK